MNQLTDKELSFLMLVFISVGLLSWLLVYSLEMTVSGLSLALLAAISCVLLARQVAPRVLSFMIISVAGGLGLMLGSVMEFGRLGLFSLSSLCLSVAQIGGLDVALRMFVLSPFAHLGMWLGCMVALLTVGRMSWSGHLFCLLGMIVGMVLGGALSFPIVGLTNEYSAAISVIWMWLWMCAGMFVPHWLFSRRRTQKTSRLAFEQ